MSSTLRAIYLHRRSRHSASVMLIIAIIIERNWNAVGHATLVVLKQMCSAFPEKHDAKDDRKCPFSRSSPNKKERERKRESCCRCANTCRISAKKNKEKGTTITRRQNNNVELTRIFGDSLSDSDKIGTNRV